MQATKYSGVKQSQRCMTANYAQHPADDKNRDSTWMTQSREHDMAGVHCFHF